MSKKERYIVRDDEENSLTMSQKAVEKLLANTAIDKMEIDAVLLERSEDSFLESTYYTNSKNAEVIRFPKNGLSHIHNETLEKHMYWV